MYSDRHSAKSQKNIIQSNHTNIIIFPSFFKPIKNISSYCRGFWVNLNKIVFHSRRPESFVLMPGYRRSGKPIRHACTGGLQRFPGHVQADLSIRAVGNDEHNARFDICNKKQPKKRNKWCKQWLLKREHLFIRKLVKLLIANTCSGFPARVKIRSFVFIPIACTGWDKLAAVSYTCRPCREQV